MKKLLLTSFITAITTVALLAQDDTGFSASYSSTGHVSPVFWVIYGAVMLFMLVALWKVFTKAGQPGWGILIPFLNLYFFCKIAGRPGWWLLLMLIPFVNFVIIIIICIDIAKAFGKGAGFGIGLFLLPFIFYPILAFGSAQYQGAVAAA